MDDARLDGMPGNPFTDPNWAPDLANTVERLVGTVRESATDKAVTAVRALVFGMIMGIAGLVALAVSVIIATKLLQRIVTTFGWIDRDSSVWVSYLVMAGVLLLCGFVCMRMRHSKADLA